MLFLLSAWAHLSSPAITPWMGVVGLAFPAFALLQLGFTFYWIVKWRRFAWLSITVCLLGYPVFPSTFQWAGHHGPISGTEIRVLSYNVHHWSPLNPQEGTSEDMIRCAEQSGADILFIQEDGNAQKRLNYPHHLHVPSIKGGDFGFTFYSNFPFKAHGRVEYSQRRGVYRSFAWADVSVNDRMVRCINVHLVNTSLQPEQYQSLSGTEENNAVTAEQLEREGTDIYKRLTASYSMRAVQVDELVKFIEESPYPIILAGDFNDTPTSYAYAEIADRLKDSFVESGRGMGDTYNKINAIPLRIDYIFAHREMKLFNHKVLDCTWSDHKPISAVVSLP